MVSDRLKKQRNVYIAGAITLLLEIIICMILIKTYF